MNLLPILFCAYLLSLISGFPGSNEWRGIVPLKSTRADVERLLGPPDKSNDALFVLNNENVLVLYSLGSCETDPKGWNVPRDVVTEFTVFYRRKVPISTLKLNKDKYQKFNDPELRDLVYYKNESQGLIIQVNTTSGLVNKITFFPEAKLNYQRCPVSAGKNSNGEDDDGFIDSRKFDEYSEIPFTEEQEHLDAFAKTLIQLQQTEAEAKGYIIAYSGRGVRAGEAQERADRAKNYLVNEKGIKADRIVTVKGGCRESSTVELWIRPNGGIVPTPSPTSLINPR
jgi:hypothetical protein